MTIKKNAFTLAEVMITLTVIGVLATIIIPVLFQNTDLAGFKAAFKSNYSNLELIAMQIKGDTGGNLMNVFRNGAQVDAYGSEVLKNKFRDKLKYIKDCNGTTSFGGTGSGATAGGCWHSSGKWKLRNNTTLSAVTEPGLVTSAGVLVYFSNEKTDCSSTSGSYNRCSVINFDINGFKAPNTVGLDIFSVSLNNDGLIPYGSLGVSEGTCLTTGYGCAAEYLYN